MSRRFMTLPNLVALSLLTMAWSALPARAQLGPFLTGAGPINRSMGGAAVAAPIDGMGSLFWNPATSSALPSSSLDFGMELLWPQTSVASSLPANAFGPVPPVTLSGSNRADNGIFPLPSVALVYRPDGSMMTYGLGMFAVAGFGVNYPAGSPPPNFNPILSPQFPKGFGFGNIFSELQVMQIAPTASIQVTDRLSIGGGPTVSLATLRLDPLVIASPDPISKMYPPGTHTREAWGGGFQIGAYYNLGAGWALGASYKSPQWFEDFHFVTTDSMGNPRGANFNLNLPGILSGGVGYTGFDRWVLAADFRWVDYADAEGFRQSGFSPTGAVLGVGFRSIFAMSLGAQYLLTDNISLRAGYSFNQDPIPDNLAIFNVASPTIIEHTLYVGASYRVTNALSLSMAYVHAFSNSITGPYVTPLTGPIAGSFVTDTTVVDTFLIGATVRFGCHAN